MKRTVRNNSDANWKWACESEENFRSFTDEVRAAAHRAGQAKGKAGAFKEISDALLKRGAIEVTAGHRVAASVLAEMASALLARAEEVEREQEARGIAGDRCEAGNECGRAGCPECQQ